uniref:Uncharacterized protein n=1 Tax=uncultured prokaryote TaxID=198431 RepID=A0A0H5QGB1_9ZZZZ|nr:hypothetical protein [uncultured prokaryote]
MKGGKRKGAWAAPVAPAPARREIHHSTLSWVVEVAERPTVEGLRDALDFFERYELEVVERLRDGGTSWNDLRHAYGVSTPQGARLRVVRLRERLAGRPRSAHR